MSPPLSEAQQQVRSKGIGASEIAAVCGVHPHTRPIDIYSRKANDAPDDFEGNDATAWGYIMEPVIAKWYEGQAGVALAQGKTVRNADHPICVATPDFIHSDGTCLVQCKNVGIRVAWHWEEEEVAEYVDLQEQWEMLATGIHQARVVACIGGLPPKIYEVEYKPGRVAMMLEIAERFWRDHVEKRIPPAADGTDSYKEFLARRFPRDDAPMMPATSGLIALAEEYEAARELVKTDDRKVAEIRNALCLAIGDAAGFWWDGGKVTWKARTDGSRALRVKLNDTRKGWLAA